MLEEDHEVGAETARRRVRRERCGSRADREDAAGRVHCEERQGCKGRSVGMRRRALDQVCAAELQETHRLRPNWRWTC